MSSLERSVSETMRGVEPAPVYGPCRLTFGRFEAERNEEQLVFVAVHVGKRHVVVKRNERKVRQRQLRFGDIRAVHLQLQTVRGTEKRHAGRVRGREQFHGMIERELVHFRLRRDALLRLCHDVVDGLRRERRALVRIEIQIRRIHLPFQVVVRRLRTPRDSQFDVVMRQRNQRERGGPIFAEPETQREEGVLAGNTGRLALGIVVGKNLRAMC